MVLGLDGAKKVLDRHPELMAYFIFARPDGSYDVWFSPSLKEKIED
jgi:thiamine biosynthesis lipoprotein